MQRHRHWILVPCFAALAMLATPVASAPPYVGTIFIEPDLITEDDPTDLLDIRFVGQGLRTMFDRRENAFVQRNAWLFGVEYRGGAVVKFQVNPEFTEQQAAAEVEFYAPVIGRLPRALRTLLQTSWIHRGDEFFGGGNNNLLIHTGGIAQGYIQDGILEETLVHEAVHTSLDAAHAQAPRWLAAQALDGGFISIYGRDNSTREDLAESVVPWLATRCDSGRLTSGLAATAAAIIPARLAYLDSLSLDLSPWDCGSGIFGDGFEPGQGTAAGNATARLGGIAPSTR
jgi:hypothetical protein